MADTHQFELRLICDFALSQARRQLQLYYSRLLSPDILHTPRLIVLIAETYSERHPPPVVAVSVLRTHYDGVPDGESRFPSRNAIVWKAAQGTNSVNSVIRMLSRDQMFRD